MNSSVARRPYASARRAEAAARTRQTILQAVATCLADGGIDQISFEAVAARAGVAARTVYRHFPTRQKLLNAFWIWLLEKLQFPAFPQTEQDLLTAPPRVFAMLDQNERLVRSFLASQISREIRQPVDTQRQHDLRQCLSQATRGLPKAEADRAIAVVQTLFSAPAWQVMRDRLGLTGLQAGQAVAWAIEVLLRELHLRRHVSEQDTDDLP